MTNLKYVIIIEFWTSRNCYLFAGLSCTSPSRDTKNVLFFRPSNRKTLYFSKIKNRYWSYYATNQGAAGNERIGHVQFAAHALETPALI